MVVILEVYADGLAMALLELLLLHKSELVQVMSLLINFYEPFKRFYYS